MSISEIGASNNDHLYQLAGITGLGWTVSILGYLSTVFANEDTPGTSLVTNPQSLLYLGAFLFVVTLGLDRLRYTRSNE
jgi:hypothetical protein